MLDTHIKVFLIIKEMRECKKRERYEELTCQLVDHYKDELTKWFENWVDNPKSYTDKELNNYIMHELHVTFNI